MTEREIEGIKAVFEVHGAMANREWSQRCWAAGVWDEEIEAEVKVLWGMDRIRHAVSLLNRRTPMPWALPCPAASSSGKKRESADDPKGPIWKQLDFMTYADLEWNMRERCKDIETNIGELSRIAIYTEAKFERLPDDIRESLSRWQAK